MSIISMWDKAVSTEATNEILSRIALRHLGEVGNLPEKEHIANCLTSGNIPALCDYDLDVSRLEPLPAYHLGQALAFFRKRVDLDLGVDREQVAYSKFVASERSCKHQNDAFLAWGQGRYQFRPCVEAALHTARRKISQVLGSAPSLEQLRLRFGPGATTQVQKRLACPKVKLSQVPACSKELVSIAGEILDEMPHYRDLLEPKPHFGKKWFWESESRGLDSNVETGILGRWVEKEVWRDATVDCEVHPGILSFVPKNAKTDRAIVVEPWLNSVCQLGAGDLIASKLKRWGIDITDQTVNQRLAREGSITGALATLDLSSASDSISIRLVEHLLPPDWYALLSKFRTGDVCYKSQTIHLEKFSSMGNGFTFPLETLIFWALTRAVCEDVETVSVYGDDIICPTHRVGDVVQVLESCGFSINREKSFWEGSFRESCGADYISGIDVRPVFMTGPLTGHDAFRLHNFYVRSGRPDFASHVKELLDPSFVLYGPDGFGDGHLIGEWEPRFTKKILERGYGGAIFDTWCYTKREFKTRLPGDRILPLYTIYLRDEATSIQERTQIEERKLRAWLLNQDPDLAPSAFESQGVRFLKDGTPVNFLPGTKGCRRISIYTFER